MKLNLSKPSPYFYLPALSALLIALSRLPLQLGFLVFFSFIPLFSLLAKPASKKQLLLAGFSFSAVYALVSLHWLTLVTPGGYAGIFPLFTIYFFLLFLLVNRCSKKLNIYLTFPIFWLSFEYLQTLGEFRFPWFNAGYSLVDYNILLQPAEIGGVYFVSLIILVMNIVIHNILKGNRRSYFTLLAIILVWIGYGLVRLSSLEIEDTGKKVALVQISVPQDKKWERSYRDTTLDNYRKFTFEASKEADLVIWPESAMPDYVLAPNRSYIRHFIKRLNVEAGVDIFTGFPYYIADASHPEKYRFYNCCTLFPQEGEIPEPYFKNILVPFGERMPFLHIFPFLWSVQLGQANFEYGDELSFYEFEGLIFSPQICFEIVFPEHTRRMAAKSDFIVNLTNDAWFKRSAGTYQHSMLTRVRAIETRTQIFRAANTGYTMIVSPSGKIEKRSKLFEQTVITSSIKICKNKSLFTKYLFWFPLVPVGLSILIFGFVIFGGKRKE